MSPLNPLPMQTLKRVEDGVETTTVTVFFPSGQVESTDSTNPNFDAIMEGAINGDESIIDMFHVSRMVEKRFERLSERVTVKDGVVHLDGVATHNALTDAILRALEEGLDDWSPLVKFFERVLANPNEHSREQLYAWLASENFTLTEDGLIVGYKYVYNAGEDPENPGQTLYTSTRRGYAIVDDVEHGDPDGGEQGNELVPNRIGSVITMPRDMVQHDPAVSCHRGLHVGTWGYSGGNYTRDVLTVLVDPRDVVSVPTDSGGQKLRCCRYIVLAVNDGGKFEGLVLKYPEPEADEPETIHGFPVGARVRTTVNPGNAGVGALGTVDPSVRERYREGGEAYMIGSDPVIPVRWDEDVYFQNDGEYYAEWFELVEDEDRSSWGIRDEEVGFLNRLSDWVDAGEDDDLEVASTTDVEDALDNLGDAVDDLRDAFGRFTNGNPGRPGSARDSKGRFTKES